MRRGCGIQASSVKTGEKRKATPPRKGWANTNNYYKLNPRKDNRDLSGTGTNTAPPLLAVARVPNDKAIRKRRRGFCPISEGTPTSHGR